MNVGFLPFGNLANNNLHPQLNGVVHSLNIQPFLKDFLRHLKKMCITTKESR